MQGSGAFGAMPAHCPAAAPPAEGGFVQFAGSLRSRSEYRFGEVSATAEAPAAPPSTMSFEYQHSEKGSLASGVGVPTPGIGPRVTPSQVSHPMLHPFENQ